MKKTHIAILILVAIIGFAGVDFLLNPTTTTEPITVQTPDEHPNYAKALIDANPATLDFQVAQRNRTTQIFEKVDLTNLADIRVYRNQLTKTSQTPDSTSYPIILYEIQGPTGQGGITYLNVKLKINDQISATEQMNETNEFGQASFYYNDINSPSTTFILARIGDNLFGFQFRKNAGSQFNIVKEMLDTLMSDLSI